MAFVVEDGTGRATATAYIAVAFADSYFEDRAVSAWTGTDDAKQAAIIRATDYIDGRWGARFKGTSQFDGVQALKFPRLNIGADGTVPTGIKRACAEYAVRALLAKDGRLAPDPVVDASGRAVASTKKKVGPIETELSYATDGPGAAVQTLRPYPEADMLIRPYLKSSAGVVR